MDEQRPSDNVLHEDAHDDNIREEMEDASTEAHIAPVAVAAGANPTKAEYDAMVAKFNKVVVVLEGAGLLPAA